MLAGLRLEYRRRARADEMAPHVRTDQTSLLSLSLVRQMPDLLVHALDSPPLLAPRRDYVRVHVDAFLRIFCALRARGSSSAAT